MEKLYNVRLKNDKRIIFVYQGERGEHPELDIKIKYLEPGKRERTPQHLHWTIDLIIKKEHKKKLTKDFIGFLLGMWEKVKPFRTKAEQLKSPIKFALPKNLTRFDALNRYGEYSVEFIATVIELLMVQEKTGCREAFMFKGVLEAIQKDKDIFSIVASAAFKGRK